MAEYPKWGDPRLRWGMPGLRWNSPLPSYITNPPDLTKKGKNHMASNNLPEPIDQLLILAEDAEDGAHNHQDDADLMLKQNREDDIHADRTALDDPENAVQGFVAA